MQPGGVSAQSELRDTVPLGTQEGAWVWECHPAAKMLTPNGANPKWMRVMPKALEAQNGVVGKMAAVEVSSIKVKGRPGAKEEGQGP